ncbi:MAG: class I SAM-dependent RNA methyltransferase, partial [Firmicutes bacterium]|nr:class I SAM-dependent RNA methyltransferase [Bacillota bacterium]
IDPFCGSGTIAIEAAMVARNIAPGLSRKYDCTWWEQIPPELWKEEKAAAFKTIDYDAQFKIIASDIDPRAIRAAKKNAEEAGVDDCIEFVVSDVKDLKDLKRTDPGIDMQRGVMIANPPYGIRIGEAEQLPGIYGALRNFLESRPQWSLFLITADKSFEEAMGRPADRRRKLYNGDLEVCYYQYYGQK